MTRPLRVGIQLPEVEYEPRWTDLCKMARIADDVGLDSLWVGDHHLYRDDGGSRAPWEAWTQLAAIAAVTSRVTLGPLVAATGFHEPAVLARMAVMVDEVSGGRLVLGLGAGWNETEYRALGFAWDHRVSRFEEAFTIVRTLLRDGAIDFRGRFYELRDCELLPRGPRPGGIPLMVGSSGPRMLRITLPHVQAWNAWYTAFDNRPEGVPACTARLDEACHAVGRPPSEVRRTVAVRVDLDGATGARRRAGELVTPLAGPPGLIAQHLRDFAGTGVQEVQLVIDPVTPSGVEGLAPILEALDREG